MAEFPPLKPLHPDSSLIQAKLDYFNTCSTDEITLSLCPGQKNCLKARPDGTILDGHHRTRILRLRGIDIDLLPREIITKE